MYVPRTYLCMYVCTYIQSLRFVLILRNIGMCVPAHTTGEIRVRVL